MFLVGQEHFFFDLGVKISKQICEISTTITRYFSWCFLVLISYLKLPSHNFYFIFVQKMTFSEHGVWLYRQEVHTKWYSAVWQTSLDIQAWLIRFVKLPWLHDTTHWNRRVDKLTEDTDSSGSDQIIQVLCTYY